MHQSRRETWWFLATTGGIVRTPVAGQGDPFFLMIKLLGGRCSASGLRLALAPLAIKSAGDHASFHCLAEVRHVGPPGSLGVVPADGPLMVGIKEKPTSTAKAQFLRWLIDQGRWAKTQGLPKAFNRRVPLPNKGIPKGR